MATDPKEESDFDANQRRSRAGLRLLREPFPPHQISQLPKETKFQIDERKANRNVGISCKVCGSWHHRDAIHLDYVGHAAATDRLLDADLNWNWEPVALDEDGLPRFDNNGGLWIRLNVAGTVTLGYGHAEVKSFQSPGDRIKECIGDAIRNALMRRGGALELWHKGDLHIEEEEVQDKQPGPTGPAPKPKAAPKPKGSVAVTEIPAQTTTKPALMAVLKAFTEARTEAELLGAGSAATGLTSQDQTTARRAYIVRLDEIRLRTKLTNRIADAMSQELIDYWGTQGVSLGDLYALETVDLERIVLWLDKMTPTEAN